jgi:nitrite reductase/ring-hydroxylating ferredoxin subunit
MTEREVRLPLADAPAEGTVTMVGLSGHRIGLYRVAGAFHALADRCPHRGAPLCAGMIATPFEVDGEVVTLGAPRSIVRCPWHKWEFDIASGRCLVDPKLRVRRYAVRVDGADVVVTLDHADESPGLGGEAASGGPGVLRSAPSTTS